MEEYVSLGSACRVAMELKRNKMRSCAFCFDVMWNKHSGLINIIDILQDDFKKFSQRDNYIRQKQFKITNKRYPDIGLPHSKQRGRHNQRVRRHPRPTDQRGIARGRRMRGTDRLARCPGSVATC